jgi:hypothetical protein
VAPDRPIPATPPLSAARCPCPRRSAAIHVGPAGPGRPEGGPLGRAQFRSALASSTGPRPPPHPHLAGSPAQRQREDCLSTAQEARPTGRPAAVPLLSRSPPRPIPPSRVHPLSSRATSPRPIPTTPPLTARRPCPRRSAAIHVDPAGPGRPEGGPLGRAQFRSALASSTGPRPPPPPHLAGSPAQRQREDCLSTAQEARPTGRPAAVPRLSTSRSPATDPRSPVARPSALVARPILATDPRHPAALRRAVPVPPPIGRHPRRPCRPWAARGRAPGPRAVPQRPGVEHRSPPATDPAPRRIPRPTSARGLFEHRPTIRSRRAPHPRDRSPPHRRSPPRGARAPADRPPAAPALPALGGPREGPWAARSSAAPWRRAPVPAHHRPRTSQDPPPNASARTV